MVDCKVLEEYARKMRVDCANMFWKWGHGHFGGCYSAAEIIAVLYFYVMNVRPDEPKWAERDRFILSKGHAAAIFFSALAQKGFIPRQWLEHYGELGANLNTHPSMDRVTGLDVSSGSLGHGLPVGTGMAYAAKMDGKDYMTYVLLGDGECHEGMIWEAAMQAGHYGLDNLVAIVDRNRLCIAGDTEQWMRLEPFADKWKAFNWDVYEVDGHNVQALAETFDRIRAEKNGRPKVIIANTVKGKGVSFMENDYTWHSNSIDQAMYDTIMTELGEQ